MYDRNRLCLEFVSSLFQLCDMNENMLVPVPHGEAYERLSSKKDEVLNQQMEVREKRIEIARRLESMKNSFVERERKMQQLEKDMFGLKKKDLVRSIFFITDS